MCGSTNLKAAIMSKNNYGSSPAYLFCILKGSLQEMKPGCGPNEYSPECGVQFAYLIARELAMF